MSPLANKLFENPTLSPEDEAASFVNADNGVADSKAALEGARYILMERFSENAELIGKLRELLWEEGLLKSTAIAGKEEEGAKFRDYFEYDETVQAGAFPSAP